MLSAVSQQIQTIQECLKSQAEAGKKDASEIIFQQSPSSVV